MPSDAPPMKKQRQVLLGAWLSQPDDTSNGVMFNNKTAGNHRSAASSSKNNTPGVGSGATVGSDPWAKYGPPSRNRRSRPNDESSQAQQRQNQQPNDSYNRNKGPGVCTNPPASLSRPALDNTVLGGSAGVGAVVGVEGAAVSTKGALQGREDGSVGCVGDSADKEAFVLPEGMDDIMADLCEEQRHVVELVLKGKSVFFTGSAGTGKSFLLKKLHQALRHVDKGAGTFLTGTTGKAAVGIGGCTIHSFAGIGMGNQPVDELLSRVQRGRQSQKRWGECQVLIIDEISMMEADLFDKLNIIGQRMKASSQPFGGIQLVLCGDFFQLPPVGIGRGSTRFCFEARTWDTAVDHSIVLKQVFRQKDPLFLNILHEMREGKVSDDAKRILAQKVGAYRARQQALQNAGARVQRLPSAPEEGQAGEGTGAVVEGEESKQKEATFVRLFSKNDDVNRLNELELRQLQGASEFFEASDSGEPTYLTQLQKHCAAPETLELKVGAKVLLLKNLDSSSKLVNGATGVVTEFVLASGRKLPKVEFDPVEGSMRTVATIREEEWSVSVGSREVARRVQLPLRLAWALSVHKAQGMTIPHVMVSTVGMFEYGQAYVALSRATTLDGLLLVDFDASRVKAHHKVKAFYRGMEERALRGSSGAVTAVPRQGEAPKAPSEWISRSDRSFSYPSRSQQAHTAASVSVEGGRTWAAPSKTIVIASGASGGGIPRGSVACGGGGSSGGISPAARERMEANRQRALAKLAEKRVRALEASAALGNMSGALPGGEA